MRARSRRNSHSSSARGLKLAAMWAVIASGLGGFGAAAVFLATRAPDAYALCRQGAVPAASTIVIVDPSDELTRTHRNRVSVTIRNERDRLPPGGRFSILTLAPPGSSEPIEVLSVCNPGSPADANPWWETTAKIEKRWKAEYVDPIDGAILRVGSTNPTPVSRLIASVAGALTRPDFDSRVAERRLVIISDMMENEKGIYSQLRGGDFWKAYSASPFPRRVTLNLTGVAVEIDYLTRQQYAGIQGEAHRDFWRRLFSEAGAERVDFIGALGAPASPIGGERLVKRQGGE